LRKNSSKTYKPAKEKPKARARPRKGWFMTKLILNVVVWSAIAGCMVLAFFAADLPDINKLQSTTRKPGISIVTQDGTLVATAGEVYGSQVSVDDLPPHVWQAILAVEDRRFFDHFGVDVLGLARAAWTNYQADRVVQGGSTITQQLAKNFFQTEKLYGPNDRSLRRKVQEVLYALWLERKFTKKQILGIYLNRVYLGAGVFGIEAAAQKYFGKRAKSLNVYESAVIAGLLKAPSRYSPSNSPDRAHERAQTVLKTMVEAGFIKPDVQAKYDKPPEVINATHETAQSGRYFVDWIVESLPNYIGPIEQDILVVTTLDPKLQRQAEATAEKFMAEHSEKRNVSELGLISMTADGAVRAVIGGRNHDLSVFNRATQAKRQAGSSIKPFVYLAALERGLEPTSMISDEKICFKSWCPKNYHWDPRGSVRVVDALAYSINTATVRLAKSVGVKNIQDVARRLGLDGAMPDDLSIVLGSIDVTLIGLTSAYASIANGGLAVIPYGVLEVRDRTGKVLYRRQSPGIGRVIEHNNAKHMAQMLRAVVDYGTGKNARLNSIAAGKTGTSQKHQDAWFVGFATDPHLVTGVWLGNDDNTPMNKVTGGNLAAQLWQQVMAGASRK
jgi:penicillin-binding protein 1A